MSHTFRLPDIGEGLTDADIVEWSVAVGDSVDVDQLIVEIETAKTTVEITSTHAGTVLSLGGAEGETINVGDVLFVIGQEGDAAQDHSDIGLDDVEEPSQVEYQPTTPSAASPVSTAPAQSGGEQRRVKAMPIVRKLASDRGLDLEIIEGSGPGGSITRSDVEKAVDAPTGTNRVPLSRIRQAIAAHMTESWATIPHVTVQADIHAQNLLDARTRTPGGSLPIEAIVAGAVLPLLERYPEFNASVYDDGVDYKRRYNLGFGVDTEEGLLVVVVRDADTLTLEDLASEFSRLAAAAHAGELLPEEAVGQSFTISNIGALGGGHGTPIIPLGTTAILSVGRAVQSPVVVDGTIDVGLVAPIDLSYDHRLIDGGLGQRFLSDLVGVLEDTDDR